jgi:hypothetical protein
VLGRDHDEAAGGRDDPAGGKAAKEEAPASEMFDDRARKPASV